jgi:hypothetical protein
MSTTLLLILSGALIAAGVGIIWRDVHSAATPSWCRVTQTHAATAGS